MGLVHGDGAYLGKPISCGEEAGKGRSPLLHKAWKALKKLLLETLFLSFYPCQNGTLKLISHQSICESDRMYWVHSCLNVSEIFGPTVQSTCRDSRLQVINALKSSLHTRKSTEEWCRVEHKWVATIQSWYLHVDEIFGHPAQSAEAPKKYCPWKSYFWTRTFIIGPKIWCSNCWFGFLHIVAIAFAGIYLHCKKWDKAQQLGKPHDKICPRIRKSLLLVTSTLL